MKTPLLMVVLLSACAATQSVRPSVAAEVKALQLMPASALYSDPGMAIAGQRFCWVYYFPFELNRVQRLPGWRECEARSELVWENRDRKTGLWEPEKRCLRGWRLVNGVEASQCLSIDSEGQVGRE